MKQRQIVIEAHYYDLLDDYLKDFPNSNEKEFIKNEIDFYEDFVKEFEEMPFEKLYDNEYSKEKQLIEYKKYLNYFKDKLRTFTDQNKKDVSGNKTEEYLKENPHPRIFTNALGFSLFVKLKDSMAKDERYDLTNFSFIYRQMLKDGFIYDNIGDGEFRKWLNDTFEIAIGKTKQLYLCSTGKKEPLYTIIKDSIK